MRIAIAVHQRRERRVHELLNVGNAAEALAQLDARRAALDEHLAHAPVDVHVRAPEPIDRLLRIADDEELAGDGNDLLPARLGRIIGGEQQQQLGLQWIGVLELVDEEPPEATLEMTREPPRCS